MNKRIYVQVVAVVVIDFIQVYGLGWYDLGVFFVAIMRCGIGYRLLLSLSGFRCYAGDIYVSLLETLYCPD